MDQYLKDCFLLIEKYNVDENVIKDFKNTLGKLNSSKAYFNSFDIEDGIFEKYSQSLDISKILDPDFLNILKNIDEVKNEMSNILLNIIKKLQKPYIVTGKDFFLFEDCIKFVRNADQKIPKFDRSVELIKTLLLAKYNKQFKKEIYGHIRSVIESDRNSVLRLLNNFPNRENLSKDELVLRDKINDIVINSLHREFNGKGEDAILNNFLNNKNNFKKLCKLNNFKEDSFLSDVNNDEFVNKKFKQKINDDFNLKIEEKSRTEEEISEH